MSKLDEIKKSIDSFKNMVKAGGIPKIYASKYVEDVEYLLSLLDNSKPAVATNVLDDNINSLKEKVDDE